MSTVKGFTWYCNMSDVLCICINSFIITKISMICDSWKITVCTFEYTVFSSWQKIREGFSPIDGTGCPPLLYSSLIGWIMLLLEKLHAFLLMCHSRRQIHYPEFKVRHVILLTSCTWVPVTMLVPGKTCNSIFSPRKISILRESLSVLCAQIT